MGVPISPLKGRLRNDTWTTAGSLTGRELDSEYAYQGAKIRQRQFLTYRANKVFILILTADERVYASWLAITSTPPKPCSFTRSNSGGGYPPARETRTPG